MTCCADLLSLLLLAVVPFAGWAHSIDRGTSPFASVCYPGLGCFSNEGNFFHWKNRPVFQLPKSPEIIQTKFILYTRSNRNIGKQIVYNQASTLTASKFNSQKPTKFLIHGYTSNPSGGWVLKMKDALLNQGDYNIFFVDWSKGSAGLYSQATSNTRVVGAVTAQFIKWLHTRSGASISNMHILGHSLGAHAAGYAGERLDNKLGRITGMDPAGPNFANCHPEVRLDPTDAKFVDVIHTDGTTIFIGGFGLLEPMGHVDFYPNGGTEQPGCTKNPIISIIDGDRKFSINCNHIRVSALVTGTILNSRGTYMGVECPNYQDFKAGRCTCQNSLCVKMGLEASKWRPNGRQHVKLYLDTSAESPFEAQQFVVNVNLPKVTGSVRQYGDLEVELVGANGARSGNLKLIKSGEILPGTTVTGVVSSYKMLGGTVPRVVVTWRNRANFPPKQKKVFIGRVQVGQWVGSGTSSYCGSTSGIESTQSVEMAFGSGC